MSEAERTDGNGTAAEAFAIPFVKALLLVRARLLIQRRAKKGDPYFGFWELPGGKMRLGETAEAALRREVEEEAGLRETRILGQTGEQLTDPFGRSARVLRPLVTVEIVSGPWPFLGHYFACTAEGSPADTAEGDTHRWISLPDFQREFLADGATGRCTTLDRLAMHIIFGENILDRFLQADSMGRPSPRADS